MEIIIVVVVVVVFCRVLESGEKVRWERRGVEKKSGPLSMILGTQKCPFRSEAYTIQYFLPMH